MLSTSSTVTEAEATKIEFGARSEQIRARLFEALRAGAG